MCTTFFMLSRFLQLEVKLDIGVPFRIAPFYPNLLYPDLGKANFRKDHTLFMN